MNKRERENHSFGSGRNQKLIAELSELARNGTSRDQDRHRSEADARWSSIRPYPVLTLIGLIAISGGLSALCLSDGIASYLAVGVFFFAIMGVILRMNGEHREAYVERQVANGISRQEAESEYRNRYDG
jgi:hypothetical protein